MVKTVKSRAMDLLIKKGHRLSNDDLSLVLDGIRNMVDAENTASRKRMLKNPHPNDIADARSRRARGMPYDKELLGE